MENKSSDTFNIYLFACMRTNFLLHLICPLYFIQEDKGSDAQALNIENVNGIFIVAFVGCSIAIVGGFLEVGANCYKNAKKFKVPCISTVDKFNCFSFFSHHLHLITVVRFILEQPTWYLTYPKSKILH